MKYKKLILIVIALMIAGCTSQIKEVKKANGNSKTYIYFKDFDTQNYHASFSDLTNSKNDNAKIIIAREKDNYYYETKGTRNQIIIQKNNVKYILNPDSRTYFVADESNNITSEILPQDIEGLKTSGYEMSDEKISGYNYYYEKYKDNDKETTYYFKGKKLCYIRVKSKNNEMFLKVDFINKKVDSKIFDKEKTYEQKTY